MPPKTERLELRLEPDIIARIDHWRAEQADLPVRSEATRRLIEAGLASSTTGQSFAAAKLQITIAALTPGVRDKISDSYVYAWDAGVYPTLHDSVDWHKPFKASFSVTSEMMEDLTELLDEGWRRKKVPSFYQLEDHYDLRRGLSDWDRSALMHACRYMYLGDLFDKDFWKGVLKRTEHPIEAGSIIRPFDRGEISLS
jgi:antitoxin MazE